MSTKIYRGYKFRQNNLNKFIELIDDLVFKYELDDWKTKFSKLPDTLVEEHIQLLKHPKIVNLSYSVRSKIARYYIIYEQIDRWIDDGYKNPSIKHDLKEVGFNLWLYKGYFYCIPWGHSQIFDKLKLPYWVADYSYWNNVDEPENIDHKEWEKRGKIWDEVCLKNVEDWDKNRLSHEIFSWKDNTKFFHYSLKIQKKLKLYKYFIGL